MVCIYCGFSTQVINSRQQKRLNQVWRRRRCLQCGAVFTSHEAVDLGASVTISSDSRSLTPFNQNALLISIYDCCRHRATAASDAQALLQTILSQLRPQIADGVLRRDAITATTYQVLSRFDIPAATMYKAYHPFKINVAQQANSKRHG